jgi:hypothetical protein
VSLANTSYVRYQRTGEMGDLNESITLHRQSLYLLSPSHPNLSLSLMNLANAVLACFLETGNAGDLEEAITLYHESLHLVPP